MSDADEYSEWVECSQCFGNGRVAGCFEDTCVCTGDPEDPDFCCAPRKCDVCRGKGGWEPDDLIEQSNRRREWDYYHPGEPCPKEELEP